MPNKVLHIFTTPTDLLLQGKGYDDGVEEYQRDVSITDDYTVFQVVHNGKPITDCYLESEGFISFIPLPEIVEPDVAVDKLIIKGFKGIIELMVYDEEGNLLDSSFTESKKYLHFDYFKEYGIEGDHQDDFYPTVCINFISDFFASVRA